MSGNTGSDSGLEDPTHPMSANHEGTLQLFAEDVAEAAAILVCISNDNYTEISSGKGGALQLFDEDVAEAAVILMRISNDKSTEIDSSKDETLLAAHPLDFPRFSSTESCCDEERAATICPDNHSFSSKDFTKWTHTTSPLLNLRSDS
ncbi:hypothetical protein B7494_g6847 [Chlorociboria aeruginascens]|nr:hypothetical protein B7494_g6847 [Chlorociboria aeruginascens]